ncbi:MAG: 16S rRNA (guanine(527)-N(7))-methyltransferase RsmG [Atopobiaceae bacterium]
MTYDELVEELTQDVEPYGIELTDKQKDKLVRHLMLVIQKNQTVNLTRITNERDAVVLHILDSLLMAGMVEETPKGRFMDIGTGAGFPGIPLVVVTGRKGVLVDSVAKKANAVEEFVQELGLRTRATVRAGRVEEMPARDRCGYTAVVARAVGQINTLIEYAAPLLQIGGRLVVTKAYPSDEEMEAGLRAAEICGFEPAEYETHDLPRGLGHREIYSYELVRHARIGLPRKVGMAQHHPLGLR